MPLNLDSDLNFEAETEDGEALERMIASVSIEGFGSPRRLRDRGSPRMRLRRTWRRNSFEAYRRLRRGRRSLTGWSYKIISTAR